MLAIFIGLSQGLSLKAKYNRNLILSLEVFWHFELSCSFDSALKEKNFN